jgi:thermitase
MRLNKTFSLFTLAAITVTTLGCGRTPANFADFSDTLTGPVTSQSVSSFSNMKNGDVIPGEYIVKMKPGAVNSMAADNSTTLKVLGNSGMKLVRLDNEMNAGALKNNPSILWMEPNRVIKVPKIIKNNQLPAIKDVAGFPNDPMFEQQYSHKIAHAQDGWKISSGNSSVIIAVVDTGVDSTHPDLKDKIVPGHSSFEGEDPGVDNMGHGTHCAGIAAASVNNGIGVAGVAPSAKIQPVKVLDDQGSGTLASVAEGMVWAASHGAKVLSMSLGGPSSSKAIEDAVALAIKNDVLVVAAMGNDGNSQPSFPAAIKGVMAVGATDSNDKIANFSQFGQHISVSAPGVDILSTFPQNQNGIGMVNYGSISGTSMATPYVAGLAALVRGTFPNLTAKQTREKIEKSSDDLGKKGFDQNFGFGRVNVAKALAGSR